MDNAVNALPALIIPMSCAMQSSATRCPGGCDRVWLSGNFLPVPYPVIVVFRIVGDCVNATPTGMDEGPEL
jgi:hypothetical protein